MKKFFFTLFILLLLGSAVFILGWAQLTVPPGSYGVINSKTHGVDPFVVRSGEFRWIWYKLIPTNVQVAVFRLDPQKFDIKFNSSLPAGDSYAAFAGLGADFSWDLKAVMSFNLNPDSLVSLVERENITSQDALDAYLYDMSQNIEVIVLRSLSSEDTDSERIEKILSGEKDVQMERTILDNYPEISDFSLSVKSARFPDFVLYRQVRLMYEEFLAKQREYISAAFGRKAESHIQLQLHFDELERYGELLTKYPVLLEYMALEKNINGKQ